MSDILIKSGEEKGNFFNWLFGRERKKYYDVSREPENENCRYYELSDLLLDLIKNRPFNKIEGLNLNCSII